MTTLSYELSASPCPISLQRENREHCCPRKSAPQSRACTREGSPQLSVAHRCPGCARWSSVRRIAFVDSFAHPAAAATKK
eukprot:5688579-Pleurochrysis_carterae.AAC.5